MPAIKIAILLAAHFPCPRGSQAFVLEQARAFTEQGCQVHLFSYGSKTPAPKISGLSISQIAVADSPRGIQSGPRWKKIRANWKLFQLFFSRSRSEEFDFVLGQNIEGTLIALPARFRRKFPVVYQAHTLLGEELSFYGPTFLHKPASLLGGLLDRWLVRQADLVFTLTGYSQERLASQTSKPVRFFPPGLKKTPFRFNGTIPALPWKEVALYSGNLDPYQELDFLFQLAIRVPEATLVIATYDSPPDPCPPGITILQVHSEEEMRALLQAAAVLLLPRRSAAGFPIKALRYLEAEKPILTWSPLARELHGAAIGICPSDGITEFSRALRSLIKNPAQCVISSGKILEVHHDWERITQAVLQEIFSLPSLKGHSHSKPSGARLGIHVPSR